MEEVQLGKGCHMSLNCCCHTSIMEENACSQSVVEREQVNKKCECLHRLYAQIYMHPKVSKDYFHMLGDSMHASPKNLELVCF